MKVDLPGNSWEEELEEALRGLCGLLTRLQERAASYLPEGDTEHFINDVLELLDGPEQRRVQRAARALLNEPLVPVPPRKR
jgi:hypothetical protein